MILWTLVGLLVWLVLSWFLGTWLHPSGAGIWILRGGMALIGIAAAAFTIWFLRKKEVEAGGGLAPSAGNEDLDHLVRDALRRLKTSAVGRGASLADLPVIFCLGDSGSAKTTTMVHSSLDPELLAGQVFHDNMVIPTSIANLWYTRQAIFVDASGTLTNQPARWKRLVQLLQPAGITGAMRKRQQAPRAAIVCFDCENFLKPGAREATLSTARRLGSRLHEMSQALGASFPIYVLFTRADRIGVRTDGSSLFLDFVSGLTRDEALQVLGATLPVRSSSSGVYAEEEDRRLGKAFDELFYSLAERRTELLARPHETGKVPGIYEFPRELRKIRTLLVQFLIDLARPSHLNVNPFLRGFYFSGVRPIMVSDVSPMAAPQPVEPAFDAGATRIFSQHSMGSQAPAPARVATSRKVPEWVFLGQFFNDLLLKDRVALGASAVSVRTNFLRRMIFGTIAAIGVLVAIVVLASFIGNLSLIRGVRQAAEQARTMQAVPGQLPTVDQLQKLDRLRNELQTIATYKREGTPWSLRSFLYVGDNIYQPARQVYFARFAELIFNETHERLRLSLRNLKDRPDPTDSYEPAYNQLRAYLITTSNPDKSTQDFLSPVLFETWAAGRNLDANVATLARAQFDFYSTELQQANPYEIPGDAGVVAHARTYLQQFSGIDRYYVPLLTAASQKNPDVSFIGRFPDAAGIIDDGKRVIRGAFTRGGFAFMQDAMKKPANLRSEEWVLGPATASQFDPATLQQKIAETYYDDYIKQWRGVLERSHVLISQGDPKAAAKKLEVLTGATSPLLELMWFVSSNTDVGVPDINEVFAPVHAVMPAGKPDRLPDRYISGPNMPYINALGTLAANINTLANSPTGSNPALVESTTASAEAAKQAARQLVAGSIDQKLHTERLVGDLLEEPILSAQKALAGSGKAPLNEAGKAFCRQLDGVRSFFPFNPNGADLPIDQLNALIAPAADQSAGALWKYYNTTWAPFLTRVGSQYQANNAGAVKITPEFVAFFNRMSALSGALYSAGTSVPRMTYTLQQLPSNVEGLGLKVGFESLNGTGQQKTFVWTGTNENVEATAKGNLLGTGISGQWAIFRFVSNANWTAQGPSAYNLEWVMQSNGRDIILPNGKKMSYSYQLQTSGFNALKPSAMSGMKCVALVAR